MGKRTSRGIASVVTAAALTLVLIGCGSAPSATDAGGQRALEKQPDPVSEAVTSQTDALDAYVEAERATIPAILAQMPGLYADISIDPLGIDGIDYSYLYAEQVDPAAALAYFDTMIPTLQTNCDTILFPGMASYGVTTSKKIKFTYFNADGSMIWSHTFTSS